MMNLKERNKFIDRRIICVVLKEDLLDDVDWEGFKVGVSGEDELYEDSFCILFLYRLVFLIKLLFSLNLFNMRML